MADALVLEAAACPQQALGREHGHLGVVGYGSTPAVGGGQIGYAVWFEALANLVKGAELHRSTQCVPDGAPDEGTAEERGCTARGGHA